MRCAVCHAVVARWRRRPNGSATCQPGAERIGPRFVGPFKTDRIRNQHGWQSRRTDRGDQTLYLRSAAAGRPDQTLCLRSMAARARLETRHSTWRDQTLCLRSAATGRPDALLAEYGCQCTAECGAAGHRLRSPCGCAPMADALGSLSQGHHAGKPRFLGRFTEVRLQTLDFCLHLGDFGLRGLRAFPPSFSALEHIRDAHLHAVHFHFRLHVLPFPPITALLEPIHHSARSTAKPRGTILIQIQLGHSHAVDPTRPRQPP